MTETNRDRLDRFIAAVGQNDLATMEALFHPEFALHEPAGLPYGGSYQGMEGWQRFWKHLMATWTDFQPELLFVAGEATGENFVTAMRLSGRSVKTGKTFETSLLEHWVFRDGKIFRIRPHYFDTAYLAEIASA